MIRVSDLQPAYVAGDDDLAYTVFSVVAISTSNSTITTGKQE